MKSISAVIYSSITGAPLRCVSSEESLITKQVAQNEQLVEEKDLPFALALWAESYVDAQSNTVLLRPQQPSVHHYFDFASKQWVEDRELKIQALLEQRNRLLVASDWTQMPDVPLSTKAEWAEYRQLLRDVPQQSGFPDAVSWPIPPSEHEVRMLSS